MCTDERQANERDICVSGKLFSYRGLTRRHACRHRRQQQLGHENKYTFIDDITIAIVASIRQSVRSRCVYGIVLPF